MSCSTRFSIIFQDTSDLDSEVEETVREVTAEHIRQVGNELAIVQTCWPDITMPRFESRTHFPESYYKNNEKEKLTLLQAENFRQQFKYHHPKRRALVLAVENGCGLQKFVCNTLRPTNLPYLELKQWYTCGKFIADYIAYDELDRPTLPPDRILGPYTVIYRQIGHSYEIANVLCSILLGVGYDAYVVSGYATQDITENIRYRMKCPIKTELPVDEVIQEEQMENKYKLRPIRDLRSKFLLYLVQREIDKAERKKQEREDKERQEQEEREKAPPDPLFGWRVHAWVLLLPKFDVTEPIFVEPSTGEYYPIDTDVYTSVESIWNNVNYWINLQDCSQGLKDLQFDLNNVDQWEHFFVGEPMETRVASVDPEADISYHEDEKHLDCPASWSEPINIPHEKFITRYPNGTKKTNFNRCILQQYGEYVQLDGLKHKLYHYFDFECGDLIRIEDTYEHRLDHLTSVITDVKEQSTTEYFQRGREDACKFHIYNYEDVNTVEAARTLEFYYDFRLDRLHKLEMNPLFLKETFKDREDNLYFRHAVFAERGKPPPGMIEGQRRIVLSITEKFHRDPSKDAHHDIATRIFNLVENVINLKYHYAKGHVTASTRDFMKPKVADRNDEVQFSADLTFGYEAEIGVKPSTQLELYTLMMQQIKDEHAILYHLREIEDELSSFIRTRAIENAVPQLDVSLFNIEQNEEFKIGMKEKEEQQRIHQEKEVDEDIDYLAPYFIRFGNVEELTRYEAKIIRDDCLAEFKELLTKRANTLRLKFEKAYQEYMRKQSWFTHNMGVINQDDEEETINYMSNQKYLLHMYDIRLRRHLELSHSRYKALEDFLRNHEKLKVLYSF